eukprot:EST46645.1 Hypothetical protein SS50377_13448 [Spironucleus salmonicida]
MIQLKERVQALESMKKQRLSEYQNSETRVQRLKKKVEQIDLNNQELARENEDFYQNYSTQLNVKIKSQHELLHNFQIEKQQLLTLEKTHQQKREQLVENFKYQHIDLENQCQSQIYQKIGFIQQESSLREQIVKTEYIIKQEQQKFSTLRERSVELTTFQNQIITKQLSNINDETLTPFVTNIITQKENNKDINIILSQKQYTSTWLQKLDSDKQMASTQCEFEDRNVNCQIDLFDQNGQKNASFKQAVKVDSVFAARPASKISVKYVDFEANQPGDGLQAQLNTKYGTNLGASQRSATPLRFSEVDFESLNPSVFSPVQKRQLSAEIEREFERVNEKCGILRNRPEKPKATSKQAKMQEKAKLGVTRRLLEEKIYRVQQERNGLKRRMDAINLSKTGDYKLRKAEVEEIRRLLSATFQELSNMQSRLAKLKIMMQAYE